MYKKYCFFAIGNTLVFIILRVYLYSEYVKTSYRYQILAKQKESLEKNHLNLQTILHSMIACGHSKKIATDILGLTSLNLKQVYSLPKIESIPNG